MFIELISIIFPVIIIIGIGYIWNNIGNNLNQKEINIISDFLIEIDLPESFTVEDNNWPKSAL